MRMRLIFGMSGLLGLVGGAVALASAQAANKNAAFPAVAKPNRGAISSTGTDVHAFKGIPFAQPPVGDLRWRAPETAAAWEGVRSGADFGPDCMQRPDPRLRAKQISEDCLYLNVWTPATAASQKLPVMVFIYGGGFDHGSGSRFDYDGERLARKGVVFVNFNYRVGAFGFMATSGLAAESSHGSAGNYALLDQIQALRWVHDNIAAFGGDPNKVMVFGQSAGASSVDLLLISPLAKGLFQRAISESPGSLRTLAPLSAAAQPWERVYGKDVNTARQLNAEEVLARSEHLNPGTPATAAGPRIGGPIIDGWIVPRSEAEAYASGQVNKVPFIIGNVANEMGPSIATTPVRTVAAFRDYVQQRYGSFAGRVLAAYPVQNDNDVPATVATLSADTTFGAGVRTVAEEMSAINPDTYRYYFSRHRGDGPNAPVHFEEVSYVFGHLDHPSVPGDPPGGKSPAILTRPPFNATDEKLSETMMNIWVRFAATGDPNGPGLTVWPKYSARESKYLEFGATPVVTVDGRAQQLDVIRQFQQAHGKGKQ